MMGQVANSQKFVKKMVENISLFYKQTSSSLLVGSIEGSRRHVTPHRWIIIHAGA